MSLQVNVQNGTGAGKRTLREQPRQIWSCKHGHQNPGYAATCLGTRCLERRPRG